MTRNKKIKKEMLKRLKIKKIKMKNKKMWRRLMMFKMRLKMSRMRLKMSKMRLRAILRLMKKMTKKSWMRNSLWLNAIAMETISEGWSPQEKVRWSKQSVSLKALSAHMSQFSTLNEGILIASLMSISLLTR